MQIQAAALNWSPQPSFRGAATRCKGMAGEGADFFFVSTLQGTMAAQPLTGFSLFDTEKLSGLKYDERAQQALTAESQFPGQYQLELRPREAATLPLRREWPGGGRAFMDGGNPCVFTELRDSTSTRLLPQGGRVSTPLMGTAPYQFGGENLAAAPLASNMLMRGATCGDDGRRAAKSMLAEAQYDTLSCVNLRMPVEKCPRSGVSERTGSAYTMRGRGPTPLPPSELGA